MDLLRGLAIVFVVVNHLGMTSLFQLLTQEAVGFVSGAELFVLFSGLVVGMVYGPRVKDDFGNGGGPDAPRGPASSTSPPSRSSSVSSCSRCCRSSRRDALTTFVDQGTGGGGARRRRPHL